VEWFGVVGVGSGFKTSGGRRCWSSMWRRITPYVQYARRFTVALFIPMLSGLSMDEGGEIKFADVFSGIGGFRLGLEKASERFRCVYSIDNNKYANQVYIKRFGEENHHTGDIRGVDPRDIPDFDLLCAGFPCQSFSVAGKRRGFQDTRGTLFFEISRIAEAKKPAMLLLENVKGLLSNDRGQTFHTILRELGRLGYWAEWQVLNSKYFGVPQNRERVFIIGHLRNKSSRPIFPVTEIGEDSTGTQEEARGEGSWFRDERDNASRSLGVGGSERGKNLITVQTAHLHPNRWGNWFKESEVSPTIDGAGSVGIVANTISHRYYKDGSENLIQIGDVFPSRGEAGRVYAPSGVSRTIKEGGGVGAKTGLYAVPDVANTVDQDGYLRFGNRPRDERGKPQLIPIGYRRIRRLTPVECERLQGFPDGWTEYGVDPDGVRVKISDTQRYKMLGNAVSVPVITFLGKQILLSLGGDYGSQ